MNFHNGYFHPTSFGSNQHEMNMNSFYLSSTASPAYPSYVNISLRPPIHSHPHEFHIHNSAKENLFNYPGHENRYFHFILNRQPHTMNLQHPSFHAHSNPTFFLNQGVPSFHSHRDTSFIVRVSSWIELVSSLVAVAEILCETIKECDRTFDGSNSGATLFAAIKLILCSVRSNGWYPWSHDRMRSLRSLQLLAAAYGKACRSAQEDHHLSGLQHQLKSQTTRACSCKSSYEKLSFEFYLIFGRSFGWWSLSQVLPDHWWEKSQQFWWRWNRLFCRYLNQLMPRGAILSDLILHCKPESQEWRNLCWGMLFLHPLLWVCDFLQVGFLDNSIFTPYKQKRFIEIKSPPSARSQEGIYRRVLHARNCQQSIRFSTDGTKQEVFI